MVAAVSAFGLILRATLGDPSARLAAMVGDECVYSDAAAASVNGAIEEFEQASAAHARDGERRNAPVPRDREPGPRACAPAPEGPSSSPLLWWVLATMRGGDDEG